MHRAVDELLSNSDVDVVLNLTIPQAHYEVTKKTLLAGISILIVKNLCPFPLIKEKN